MSRSQHQVLNKNVLDLRSVLLIFVPKFETKVPLEVREPHFGEQYFPHFSLTKQENKCFVDRQLLKNEDQVMRSTFVSRQREHSEAMCSRVTSGWLFLASRNSSI